MKTNDLVTIVIPCYNQGEYLEESVTSAINQTYTNIEIIIINDGSSDDTEEIARRLQRKYPSMIQFISQKNSGVSEARNTAISKSKGNYILALDADDRIDPNMIDASMKSMTDNDADIIYVAIKYFGFKNFTDYKKPFSETHILYQNPCSVTSLYKKEIWNTIGGYATNMNEGYEDWEFWINAFKHGFIFHLLPEPFLFYRTQEISRNTNAENKDSYLKAKIILNHPELYTIDQVKQSLIIVKKTEALADLYFYTLKKVYDDEVLISQTISHYLKLDQLQEKQYISIPNTNKKIVLLPLDNVKNPQHLKQICDKKEVNFILFYTTLRYKVLLLKNLNFSWSYKQKIKDIHGSIFPFVFKDKREDSTSQILNYKHLVKYQNINLEIQKNEIERQVQLRREKNKHNKKQIKLIEEKNTLIQKQIKLIEEKNLMYKKIMNSVSKVTNYSLKTSPIKKYKAFKTIIRIYYELRQNK